MANGCAVEASVALSPSAGAEGSEAFARAWHAAGGWCGLWAPRWGAGAAGLPETIDRIRGGIVIVGTYRPTGRPPARFAATGFVVANGSYVVTNLHVLPKVLDSNLKEEVVIGVDAGNAVYKASVIAKDAVHDLALLKFDGPRLTALELGDSRTVREGELYAFTGFPLGEVLGLRPVTHRGIVSSITPIATPQLSSGSLDPALVKRLKNPYDVFQLDATAYPGNSGSPVFHPDTGRVIGVINKVFVKQSKEKVLTDPSAITYAIPVEHVHKLLAKVGVNPG